MVGQNTNFFAIIYLLSVVNIVFSPFLKQYGYIDEGLVFFVAMFLAKHIKRFIPCLEFRLYIFTIMFFLVYSLIMRVNVPLATIRDFLIFFKPFICFYVVFLFGFRVSFFVRRFCTICFFCMGGYLWFILPFISDIYENTTAYYPACVFVAVGLLLFSKMRGRDWFVATLILFPGLASVRAKFYAEFIVWLGIVCAVKSHIRVNLKYLFSGGAVFAVSYIVNKEKIFAYFVNGMRDEKARAYLYDAAIKILKDFFPLGPGFGTFASDSAARFYSPLNYRYHLDYIWGLGVEEISNGKNFYSDTFYPILAQFGVVGTIIFFLFWMRRWKDGMLIQNINQYKLFLFVLFYLGIQCIAENTFTGASSVPIMIVIGACLSKNTNVLEKKV